MLNCNYTISSTQKKNRTWQKKRKDNQSSYSASSAKSSKSMPSSWKLLGRVTDWGSARFASAGRSILMLTMAVLMSVSNLLQALNVQSTFHANIRTSPSNRWADNLRAIGTSGKSNFSTKGKEMLLAQLFNKTLLKIIDCGRNFKIYSWLFFVQDLFKFLTNKTILDLFVYNFLKEDSF